MQKKDSRIEEIIRVIQHIAAGKYSSRIYISESKDEIDAIATGINMLSEEVENMIKQMGEENLQLQNIVRELQVTTSELNKSQELFKKAFHSSPDSLLISRLDNGLIIDVNDGFCCLTGYTRDEAIGKTAFELNLWTNKIDREKLIAGLKEKGIINNHAIKFRRKDRQVRDTLLSAIVLMLNDIPHMLTITRDITEMKAAEEELRLTKDKYESLIKSAPDGIVVVDRKGFIVIVNEAFSSVNGYKPDELTGMHFSKFSGFRTSDVPQYVRMFNNLLKGKVPEPFEIKWHDKTGFLRTSEIHASTLREGTKITGLQAIVRDVTDRIAAIEALRSSEVQHRTTLDAMEEGIFVINRNLEITIANKALIDELKMLGLKKDIIGLRYHDAFPFLNDSFKNDYKQIFKNGKNIRKEGIYPVNGLEKLIDSSILPIYEKGKVERIITILQDITERKKLERVREIMNNISNAVNLTKDLKELIHVIRDELGKIFDTTNFFIALYHKDKDTFSLPFFVDEVDSFDELPARKTLTGYVVRNDRPLLVKDNDIRKLVESGEVEDVGSPSKIWLGVPLKIKDEIIGAVVVQSYTDENAYTQQDLEILKFVSTQIGLSIETKKAYDEVQIEKAYFEQLFQNSPETIVLTEKNGRLIRVNEEFEKLFKFSSNEAVGELIDELIVPDEYKTEARSISSRVGKGEKILTETVRQDKSGKKIYVSILGTPLEIGGEQVAVYGIYRDITPQKMAQLALKENEEKLRNILYSSPDAITVADLRGYITEGNPAAQKIFGCSSMDELIGMNALKLVSPASKRKSIKGFINVFKHGYVKNIELELILKNDRKIDVELSASLLRDAAGEPVGIVGVTKDITDRKEYEKNLKSAKEQAEESDRLKSAFLANMSHEIRTPMNAILGFSELLRKEDLTDEERDEYLQIINNKGNELLLLINDIIDISKIEAGDIRIVNATFPVDDFLKDIQKTFNEEINLLNKEQIQFRLNIPDKLNPVIETDQVRLKQIFYNLLNNALKFTHEGYIEFGYLIQDPDIIKFFVRDTGMGIPEDKQKIIFDRFRQVDESTTSPHAGTGLGLAISKNLVIILGGEIWVDSKYGQGSTFYVTLPIKDKGWTLTSEPALTAPDQPDILLPVLYGKKILIVEDDAANYLFLESFLKQTHASVLWAKDGLQALKIFREHAGIDLILMDIRMPHLNGIEATRMIRQLDKKIPVVALTAYAFVNDREQSIQAGCNEFLSKPIKIDQLSEMLNTYLKS